MDTLFSFLTPGIGFLLSLVFGFWLSLSGKPYNGILFNIHKLIALGTVILAAMQAYKILKGSEPQALIIFLIVVTALGIVALFASGALMSIGNVNYVVMKAVHNIAPVLVVITMGLTIYLLSR